MPTLRRNFPPSVIRMRPTVGAEPTAQLTLSEVQATHLNTESTRRSFNAGT